MEQGIFETKAYSAACSICGKPYRDNSGFQFVESIESFIYRLSQHSWFADHVYAICPACLKTQGGGL